MYRHYPLNTQSDNLPFCYQQYEQEQWNLSISQKNINLHTIDSRKIEITKLITQIETNIAIIACQFAQILENMYETIPEITNFNESLSSLAVQIHNEQISRRLFMNELEILNLQQAAINSEIATIKENIERVIRMNFLINL